jgi:hypothetical protein
MEGNEGSLAVSNGDLDVPPQFEFVAAPKDYFLGPVFAARKQYGAREVTINQRKYQIGGFHPMRPNFHPPALDVRHARAIFALLTFRNREVDTPIIQFSFNEFCRKYAHTNGGRYSRAIAEIVADLMDAYIRVTEVPTGVSHEYRLIERVDIATRPPRRRDGKLAQSCQQEMWFNGCTLSPEFYGILNRIAELQHLNFDVFRSIRSPLAQAVYLYIPSRAHHHTEDDPFEITLTKLLEQVSVDVPGQKNRRRQIFTQNSKSIMKQLDGVATLTGVFRVRLAETADRADWKLLAWVDRNHKKAKRDPRASKLMSAFLDSGHSQQELDRRLSSVQELSVYEKELLATATVEIEKNLRFFELAKALLGTTRFVALAAEAKGDAIEGRKARKNPTARIIWRIMEAISEKPKGSTDSVELRTGTELRRLLGEPDKRGR